MVLLLWQLKWTKVVLYGVVVLYALNTPETEIEYWKCLLNIFLRDGVLRKSLKLTEDNLRSFNRLSHTQGNRTFGF